MRDARSYRVGERVGIFVIRHLSDAEVVLAQDDKHLDVQVSLSKHAPGGEGEIPMLVLSTVVHVHNTLGRRLRGLQAPKRPGETAPGGVTPRCRKAARVAMRPRGVRCKKPCWIR